MDSGSATTGEAGLGFMKSLKLLDLCSVSCLKEDMHRETHGEGEREGGGLLDIDWAVSVYGEHNMVLIFKTGF